MNRQFYLMRDDVKIEILQFILKLNQSWALPMANNW